MGIFAGGVPVPEGVISLVVGVSTQTWCTSYIYY